MNISLLDRAIIESINTKPQKIHELKDSLGIPQDLLTQSVQELLATGILKTEDSIFYINKQNIENIKTIINSKEQIQIELLDFFHTFTNGEDLTTLKMKKVHMTDSEEKILKGLLYNVESFIKSLETNKKKKTKEQKIIFWGETNYENIINNYIA